MENRLIVLRLFLIEIGIFDQIKNHPRQYLHSSVYLMQRMSGVDLGYRFGWYPKGPLCPELERDYVALINEIEANKSYREFRMKQFEKALGFVLLPTVSELQKG
jgi:uncharacterized protein YwgA